MPKSAVDSYPLIAHFLSAVMSKLALQTPTEPLVVAANQGYTSIVEQPDSDRYRCVIRKPDDHRRRWWLVSVQMLRLSHVYSINHGL